MYFPSHFCNLALFEQFEDTCGIRINLEKQNFKCFSLFFNNKAIGTITIKNQENICFSIVYDILGGWRPQESRGGEYSQGRIITCT